MPEGKKARTEAMAREYASFFALRETQERRAWNGLAVANLYPSLHCRWNALTEKGALNRCGPGWLVGCSYGDVKIGDRDTMCWVVAAPPATWKKYLRPGVHVTFRRIPPVSPIAADESGG